MLCEQYGMPFLEVSPLHTGMKASAYTVWQVDVVRVYNGMAVRTLGTNCPPYCYNTCLNASWCTKGL